MLPSIGQYETGQRPRLVTLVRTGDPEAAIALVIGSFATVDESVELAALLAARLEAAALRAEVIPRLSGLTIVSPLETIASVRQVVSQLDRAIRTSIGSEELSGAIYRTQLERMKRTTSLRISSPERALCQGEIAIASSGTPRLEQARRLAFSEERARFGVVGTKEVVAAVDAAVRAIDPWPKGSNVPAPQPLESRYRIARNGGAAPQVQIVWWSGSIPAAIAAKRELSQPTNRLQGVLESLPVALEVGNVSLSPQSVGACLSVTLSQAATDAVPTIDDAVHGAHATVTFLRDLAVQKNPDELTTMAVVEQSDPRAAAELAARLSLATSTEALGRFDVELEPTRGATPTSAQLKVLADVIHGRDGDLSIPLVHASEPGQGQLHVLLASPCGNWTETTKTVGATGMMLRLASDRGTETGRVILEPWVSPNGTGLIARTARLSLHESPEAQAHRLGDALGRAVTAARLESASLWTSRHELLTLLGPGPRPALWSALLSLSPHHPALVIPDGQFSSIEALSITTVRERRGELLRLPLRMAVIDNVGPTQSEIAHRAAIRWLSLVRTESRDCPSLTSNEGWTPGEYHIESRAPDPNDAGLTLALPLPTEGSLALEYARLLEWTLASSNGWLAQRLRDSSVVATVDAKVVGGSKRRGLVVVVGAPHSSLDTATTAVNGLFHELGSGIVPVSPPIANAISQVALGVRLRRMDPTKRLEDLWLGREHTDHPSEAGFRTYLKQAFGRTTPTLVRSLRVSGNYQSTGRVAR